MMKKFVAGAVAGAAILAAAPAFAAGGSNPGTLNVKLSVNTGCDINGNGGIGAGSGSSATIDFGTYAAGTAGTPTTVNGADTGSSLVVTCSGTQTPSLSFDGGKNLTGGTQRNMKQVSGTGLLAYTLGSAAGGTQYAVNTAVAQPTAFTAGQARTIKIYGSVPGGVPAGADGAYTDAVQISLTW